MAYLDDYLSYNEFNECPKIYHFWSALSLLSNVVSCKVVLDMTHYRIYPNLYVFLLGEAGGRKSVAKDFAFDLYMELFPDMPVAASCESHQKLIEELASDKCMRTFLDPKGTIFNTPPNTLNEYHPYAMFINEFQHFISVNPIGMVQFLVDVYDRTKSFYLYKTKKGQDHIVHPYVSLLACDTPDNITSSLKTNVVTGGFFRRTVIAYSSEDKRIPFPSVTLEGLAALKRAKKFLQEVSVVTGAFLWDDEAKKDFSKWYEAIVLPDESMMRGFFRSKHIQALKLAMLYSLTESFDMVLRPSHLEFGIDLVQRSEDCLPFIASGVGKNEQAHSIAKLLNQLRMAGGMMPLKRFRLNAGKEIRTGDIDRELYHLKETDQIEVLKLKFDGVEREVICTKEKANEIKKIGEVKK